MPIIVDAAEVNVGETHIGEAYVGDVDLGTLEREVTLDVSVADYFDLCDDSERHEITDIVVHDDVFEAYVNQLTNPEEITTLGRIIDTRKQALGIVSENIAAQTEEERENIRRVVEANLENYMDMPPLDVIRQLKSISNMPIEQLRGFPRNFINEISEKLIEVSAPIVIYQTPPDLKLIINSMQPGEVSEDFLQELRNQVGT